MQPGTKKESEGEVNMADEGSLVVTPQKLAVAAGATRIVRLVTMKAPAKETTWRVYFEGVSEKEYKGQTQGKENSTEVGVSIVWGVLAHVAPETIIPRLKFNPDTGEIVNDGTIRMPLNEIGICEGSKRCVWKKEKATVYPDTSIRLKSVRFESGKTYRAKYFNWVSNKNEELTLSAMSR
ncbi:fimbrial protein [Serratia sp. UGAL515B_01]|uniref:fimbrial protein n=1 Tax=Serratia sp. UGAL515B_01 TaxID=2986763 RepID=UPI0029546F1B|nr:fimbrial protein [Serratia sp. UGAL515B_01]WON76147.1 fimbrial protein [Serratia sp. UGAL515B_01]